MAQFEEATGHPYHTVLRVQVGPPKLHSAQLTRELEVRLGKTFTELSVRQEQELIELGLLDFCRHSGDLVGVPDHLEGPRKGTGGAKRAQTRHTPRPRLTVSPPVG